MTTAREKLRQALEAFSQGRVDESQGLCELALAQDRNDAGALHLAAAIALVRRQPAAALAHVDAAIRANPGNARQYQTRAQAHLALGSMESAEADFRRAIALEPDFADAHASLGARLAGRGQFAEAREHLSFALAKRPDATQWQYNLALCESNLGFHDAAERRITEVLRLRPDWPPALNEYGALLIRRGEHASAVAALESALRVDPVFQPAWNQLGVAQLALGNVAAARESLARAIEIDPSDADAWTNVGNAKRRAFDRAGAERAYHAALERRPDFVAALRNLGNIQRERGQFEESKATLDRCVTLSGDPETHWSLSLTLLTMDELERGWQEYRWRDGATPDPALANALRAAVEARQPIELAGEQGLGDVLFFLRWLPLLGADPRSLALRCDPRLNPLVAAGGFQGRFVDEASPAAAGTLAVRLGDLPALLWRNGAEHPAPMPIKADATALEAARRALREAGPPPYVALAWRAGLPPSASEEHLVKVVSPERFGAALRDIRATFVSVQRKPHPGELEALQAALGKPVLDASALNDDLARITGMMAAVDSYIGVSNTNVHIGAGLGLAAGILVPFPPEWRYGTRGAASPWYPGFHLHREDPARGWDEALASLASSLRSTLEGRGS